MARHDVSVVRGAHAFVCSAGCALTSLLSCCVPNLKLDDEVVQLDRLSEEGGTAAHKSADAQTDERVSRSLGVATRTLDRVAGRATPWRTLLSAAALLDAVAAVLRWRAAADPMVGCWNSKNSFLTKRSTLLDLPTAVSPSSTSLKLTVFAIAEAVGRLEGRWKVRQRNG